MKMVIMSKKIGIVVLVIFLVGFLLVNYTDIFISSNLVNITELNKEKCYEYDGAPNIPFTKDNIQLLSTNKDCTNDNKMRGIDPIININMPAGYLECKTHKMQIAQIGGFHCEIKIDGKAIPGFTPYEYTDERGNFKSIEESGTYILLNLYEVDGSKSHDVSVCCEGVCDTKTIGPCSST